ncbi:MAG: hypothetical protein JJ714_08020 [Acidithiobacillus sp.]|nr:hypothetical protein [Acidithiobacillus sp.]
MPLKNLIKRIFLRVYQALSARPEFRAHIISFSRRLGVFPLLKKLQLIVLTMNYQSASEQHPEDLSPWALRIYNRINAQGRAQSGDVS